MGYAGVYIFFLVLLQNIDCGYSLEPPQRGVPTIYVLSKNKKNIELFSAENVQFLKLKKSLFIAWTSFRNETYSITDHAQTENCRFIDKFLFKGKVEESETSHICFTDRK